MIELQLGNRESPDEIADYNKLTRHFTLELRTLAGKIIRIFEKHGKERAGPLQTNGMSFYTLYKGGM